MSGSSGGLAVFDDILKASKPSRASIEAVEGVQATLPSAFASLQLLHQNWEAMQWRGSDPHRGSPSALPDEYILRRDGPRVRAWQDRTR
jgi:hypothetical protein